MKEKTDVKTKFDLVCAGNNNQEGGNVGSYTKW
jgi:hypothetical protein